MSLSRARVFWVLLLFTCPVIAQVYKWVDETGRVHYGDRPHPSGSKTLSLPSAPPPDPALEESRRKQLRLLDAIEQDRDEQRKTEAQTAQLEARRRRQCASAKDQLRMIERHGRLYELDEAGNRRYWDDEARDRERARLTDYIRRYCN